MQLTHSFDVPRPPAETWAILMDIPQTVACMPGVELVAAEPDHVYKGKLSVKLGPVALKFNGIAKLEEVNDAERTAVIRAKGSDLQGRGNAGATARMRIEPAAQGSRVVIDTDLQLSGLVAQYGRASGVISAVSNEIVSIFAANLRKRLHEGADVPSGAAAPAQQEKTAAARDTAIGFGLLWRAFIAWLRQRLSGAQG